MRDKMFIAIHRGGLLSPEHHHELMRWARKCAERVLPLLKGNIDERLIHALAVAGQWENGAAATGDAMKASLSAHAAARAYTDPVFIAAARAIGQAVATAHMADHSPGAALYTLKALQLAGKPIQAEAKWQLKQLKHLPPDMVQLITSTLLLKGKGFKIYYDAGEEK